VYQQTSDESLLVVPKKLNRCMERILQNRLMSTLRIYGFILVSFLLTASWQEAQGQAAEAYNDAGIRLRVWLHAVYSDANCSENAFSGATTKFVFNNVRVRASNGSNFALDDFPVQNLFLNTFAQDMRFRTRGRTNRFWRVNDSEFRMQNPYYPFERSTFPVNSTYIPNGTAELAPNTVSAPLRPVGSQSPATQGYLLMDRTFSGNKAPDRYQWFLGDAFESDADLSGNEAGGLNLLGLGCTAAFGLPQVYEGRKGLDNYDPLLTLLMLDSLGINLITWALGLGGCTNVFGIGIDPLNLLAVAVSALINDYDDSYGNKRNWAIDPAFFRGTTPGEVGYFTTQKIFATDGRDADQEGYILVFAHQWEWAGTTHPEPSGPVRIQAPLCATEQYTDAPIQLQVWLDGYFTDSDHEGGIGGPFECSDNLVGEFIIGERLYGNEEKYIRGKASTQFTPIASTAWRPTVRTTQDRPNWITVPAGNAGRNLLNYTYTESGMNTFSYALESWESDCISDDPINSCPVCIGFTVNGSCCIVPNPLAGTFGGNCVIPGIPIAGSDFQRYATTSGTVNWRNSPPDTDNFVYVPIQLSTSKFQSHLARIRYRWTIPEPVAGTVSGDRDVILCPGEAYSMTVTGSTNATWYQWQYAEVEGPAGPACPSGATWIDVNGANCPTYNIPNFVGTRVYRLKVFNRNGPGSKTPNGEKFAESFTVCTRITRLNNVVVPIDSPLECGTSANPTPVRAGSSINLRPVLPPMPGSLDVAGVNYIWNANNGGVVNPTNPAASPWQTTLTIPNRDGAPAVRVRLTTNLQDRCPTATNGTFDCFYEPVDAGCSDLTGVVYVKSGAPSGGIGSINRPFNSLQDAFSLVAGSASGPNPVRHVKIHAGTYTIPATIRQAMLLTEGLVVEGNYWEEFDATLGENIWVKRSDEVTTITSNIREQISADIVHTIGFRAVGNNWVLHDININTGNAPARTGAVAVEFGEGRGFSNYAVHIHNSTGWRMINVFARAGQGGVGTPGAGPLAENCPAVATSPALSAANSNGFSPAGIGNNNYTCTGDRSGGDGGPVNGPGQAANINNCPSAGCNGLAGQPGNKGRNGNNGSADAPYAAQTELWGMQYFVPKPPNMANVGQDGFGGGGGGGSATATGAAGGIGGKGGLPGYGSGGAFGVWISGGATGTARNLQPDLVNFSAALGGLGGAGMTGYPGGLAPAGAGAGGEGGNGGTGGRGASGFNQSLYVDGTGGTNLITDIPDGPYPPNRVDADYSSGCTNSRIILRKTSGNWGSLATLGLLDYLDANPTLSTTSGTAPDIKQVYVAGGNLGPRTLPVAGGDYHNFVYVRFDRPAPTITVPSIICSGTPVNFSSTSGLPDPLEHEWVVQEVVSGNRPTAPLTPAPVIPILLTANPSGIQLPANTGTTNRIYQVRYRVRDNCCGWSIPVYADITVIPQIQNNLLALPDTSFICNIGTPDPITTRPGPALPSGADWTFEWYQSFNGGPFNLVPAANAATYAPPQLDSIGIYRFIRILRNTVGACADTSNVKTILVTENFTDNFIDFPVPFVAECVGTTAPPSLGGAVTTSNVNIGLMTGTVPIGPGTAATIYYQWQVSTDQLNWTNIGATFASEGGTVPAGTGTPSQNWNPGVAPPISTFTSSSTFFPSQGEPGLLYFRRMVGRTGSPLEVCRDSSNIVFAEVNPNATPWNDCPNFPGTANNTECITNYPPNTALQGYKGTCALIAPDTVCPGTVIEVRLPSSSIGGLRAFGQRYAWYRVPGGPFNNIAGIGSRCNLFGTGNCTNPMLNAGCSNSKPEKANFLTFTPFDTAGTFINILIDSTTTYYMNVVGRCFDTTTFRTTATPATYGQISSTGQNRWQRRTVVTVTPPTLITAFNATDTLLCGNITPPNTITLTIVGGSLGNDGRFVIYDTDPEVGGPHTPILRGNQRDTSFAARNLTIPRPTVSTTYYARIENRCGATPALARPVVIIDAPTEPDELIGPDIACGGEAVSLTVVGGVLTPGAQWVLYNGDPTLGGTKLDSNTVGSFVHSPSGNITYYVRAEAPYPCLATDAVSKFVQVIDTCICDQNPGTIEYAPTGVLTVAPIECEDSDGWTWYATEANPTEYLFAIQKRPTVSATDLSQIPGANTNNFRAIVRINVTPNPTTQADVFYAEDLSICEANFVMPRYWNVEVDSGSVNGFVKTRFFFPPAELVATQARADAWRIANQPGCNPDPLSTGPAQVFKHNDGTFFNPGPVTPINVPVNWPTYDVWPFTINNRNYIGHLISNLPFGAQATIDGKNYVEVAWDGFSGGGIAIRVSPQRDVLPVTLVSFTGTLVEDYVQLNWETASEFNNDFFQVEKSQDGRNFFSIGIVPGAGTTSLPQYYDLIDDKPFLGDNYYRLKQVDYDGTFEYSRTIVVNVGGEVTKNGFIGVYPNPTEGWVRASISSLRDQQVFIKIMDVTGRLMTTKNVNLGRGINNIDLDLGFYPAGSYILSFTDSQGMEHNVKLVKQN
jgi:hypothetical protein